MGRPRARMTKRWELVLGFIKAYQRIHGVPPSYEIMARGLGMVAKSNVYRMVKRLEAEGLLETKRRKRKMMMMLQQLQQPYVLPRLWLFQLLQRLCAQLLL